jgi:hypothetical protein
MQAYTWILSSYLTNTGFDALVSSTFSSECASCECKNEVLIVGAILVPYRGWSLTTFLVVGALCLRIICGLCGEKTRTTILDEDTVCYISFMKIQSATCSLVLNVEDVVCYM